MADNQGRRVSRRRTPSVTIPDESDPNYRPNPVSRPGSTRKKASRPNTAKGSRPNTAKSTRNSKSGKRGTLKLLSFNNQSLHSFSDIECVHFQMFRVSQ